MEKENFSTWIFLIDHGRSQALFELGIGYLLTWWSIIVLFEQMTATIRAHTSIASWLSPCNYCPAFRAAVFPSGREIVDYNARKYKNDGQYPADKDQRDHERWGCIT